MASKSKVALKRGSLTASELIKSRGRRGHLMSLSGLVSDTASTVSASQQSASIQRESLRLENTYKMAPDSTFSAEHVEKAVKSVLESYLCDYTYNPRTCARLTCDLANMVKARVREMGYDRYKLVCQVVVGEKQDQGVAAASRFLWDARHDSHATATYMNSRLFAMATIFGLYFE